MPKVLGLDWETLISRFRCTRVDICVDARNVEMSRLLILFERAQSHGVIYLQTGRDGRVQTMYCGSSQSARHGIAYDQVDSEAYKRLVGEQTLMRKKMRDDAEVVLESDNGRVRFEVRNVLKPSVELGELEHMPTALHKFRIYEFSEVAERKLSGEDLGLLDTLRLRGAHGAREHLKVGKGGGRAVERLDRLLERHVAAWWKPDSFASNIRDALAATPIWALLTGKTKEED